MALAVQGLSQKRPVYSDKDWDSTLLMHVQVKGAGYNISCQRMGPEEAIGQGQGQQQHTLNVYRSKVQGIMLAVKGWGQKKPWERDRDNTLLTHVQVKGAWCNISCQRTGPQEAIGQGQGQRQHTLNACMGQRSMG